jgi:DNA polymerase III epsilon subunit-like protein
MLINCWECKERISEKTKKCTHCGALADDEPTDWRVWFSLIIGAVLIFIIESSFSVNGFWNHVKLISVCLIGLPVATIFYLAFKVSDKDKKLTVNPFHKAAKNPDAEPFAIVLDTETTGLVKYEGTPTKKAVIENPNLFPDIVEIAWITVSRKYEEVSRRSFIISQETKIPIESIKIHGITDEKCQKEGVDWGVAYDSLMKDIQFCDYVVGHNVGFDKKVIEGVCLKKGLKKPFVKMKRYDTMQMGKKIMKKRYFKLQDLAFKLYGKQQVKSKFSFHNAMDDAEITTNCFCWLHTNNFKY